MNFTEQFRAAVLHGLSSEPKSISPKFFYDTRGSELFEQITATPEYYLTRSELEILETHASDVTNTWRKPVFLVDLGSGSSRKTTLLFDSMLGDLSQLTYVPIDVSSEYLGAAISELVKKYAGLSVIPFIGEFGNGITFARTIVPAMHSLVFYFPGSTIGNLATDESLQLFRQFSSSMRQGDVCLVGFDLQKPMDMLNDAYNDKAGITAQFNLNLLHRINRELEGSIPVEKFEHVAFYNEHESRVEIYLRCTEDVEFTVSGVVFSMKSGEHVLTEYSHKYSLKQIEYLAEESGLKITNVWMDSRKYFADVLFCLS